MTRGGRQCARRSIGAGKDAWCRRARCGAVCPTIVTDRVHAGAARPCGEMERIPFPDASWHDGSRWNIPCKRKPQMCPGTPVRMGKKPSVGLLCDVLWRPYGCEGSTADACVPCVIDGWPNTRRKPCESVSVHRQARSDRCQAPVRGFRGSGQRVPAARTRGANEATYCAKAPSGPRTTRTSVEVEDERRSGTGMYFQIP